MEKDTSTCQWRVNAKPFTKGEPDGKWIVSGIFLNNLVAIAIQKGKKLPDQNHQWSLQR